MQVVKWSATFLVYSFVLIFIFIGCDKKEESKQTSAARSKSASQKTADGSRSFVVGSPIQDGLGDRSFADLTYIGLAKAKKELGVDLIFDVGHQTTISEAEREASVQRLIDQKVDLIVASGWQFLPVFKKFAEQYPEQLFLLNDVPVTDFANIVSTVYAQHEGSFLAGCLAGWMSKTGIVGFVGAVDLTVIHAFRVGYTEGVHYANPEAKVFHTFVTTGNDFSGFEKPEEGYNLAMEQYKKGADIIFQVAGGQTGRGVIRAAQESHNFAIGVDTNEDHIAEGNVLTSMMKRVDVSTYQEIKKILEGNFKPGVVNYGLEDKGVSLSPMEYTRHLIPKKVLSDLEEVEKKIIAGEIVVTDYLAENM